MSKKHDPNDCVRYKGKRWIEARLPEDCAPWLPGEACEGDNRGMLKELQRCCREYSWKWPSRPHFMLTDMHADTDAFLASLVASGGVRKTGPADADLRLTKAGKKAYFLIGGDCFDKGPSNLRLLRALRHLQDSGARLRILAGNHDVRLLLGIHVLSMERDPRTEHFFIRMGPKVLPLFKEIADDHLQGYHALRGIPSEAECRRRLFPRDSWFEEFPTVAQWSMPAKVVEREVNRVRKKMSEFDAHCAKIGLTLRQVYAAALTCERMLLRPGGEFYWFYQQLRLAHKRGSFLFIHAGMDDQIAKLVRDKGIDTLNRRFRKQIYHDPFEFYYGPLANTLRTKYRELDRPWTRLGADRLHTVGVHALVHGHDSLRCGQQMVMRKGMLNVQCDATVDRNSRVKEGIAGLGAAVTVFLPQRRIMGISSDAEHIKLFDPESLLS